MAAPRKAFSIRILTLRDYPRVMALWEATEGMGMGPSDSRASIALFLRRNRGLSFVAVAGTTIAAAVLCGHDGRRGFLYHLAVDQAYRKQGLGRKLALKCLAGLRAQGIHKCHIVVYTHNLAGQKFWQKIGWEKRGNLLIMSRNPNA
jgi:ribosomal protein S18 acetylase RimI-like enzyme